MSDTVTIDDVARHAGVSIKTVSRVLNKEPNVRSATREKVQAAIDHLQYQPNRAARGLASRKSLLIGLLYDNPSTNYLANLQRGIIEACNEAHYGLVLCPVNSGEINAGNEVKNWIQQFRVDGVLVTPPLTDSPAIMASIAETNIPALVLSSEGIGQVPAILINEENAAHDMTQHLIREGHSKIGFIKGHPDHYASRRRFAGYLRALEEAGLIPEPDWIREGNFDFESGQEAGHALLSIQNRPTAVFASNDDMAAGVMFVAHSQGLKIPEDLAVCGFDDTPFSRQIWPGLTTVRQPIRAMGNRGAEILIENIRIPANASGKSDTDFMDYELKIRGSTGTTA